MKTVIKPVPVEFDAAVALSVMQSPEMRGPNSYVITATHPSRPGVAIRKPFEAPQGCTVAELTNLNVWRHDLPLSWEHIVTALWVSDSDAYGVVETYEDSPVQLGELRADRSGSAADWTPREALIELLRRVDSGDYEAMDTLVLCWRTAVKKPGSNGVEINSYYSAASPDIHTTLGVLARSEWAIHQQATAE